MPGFSLLLDAGGDLADMRIGHGEDDGVGAVQRLVGGNGVDAEIVLEPLLAGVAHFDMAHLVGRALEIRGQAVAHFAPGAEKRDNSHSFSSTRRFRAETHMLV